MLAIPGKRFVPPPPTVESLEIPAPVGGLNALAAATALPEADCLLLYNMTAAELGQRVRLGWSEWSVGLTGAADNTVRTILPFSGGHKNGSTDRLFACTQSGIWDISTSGAVPIAWAPLTAYVTGSVSAAGSWVTNGGNTYLCTKSGTSAAAVGPTGTGTGIVDGGCLWNFISSNTAPSQVVAFGVQTGDAGYGTFTVMSTPAGRFLLYVDEENGYYIYPEGGPFAKVTQGAGGTQINGIDPGTFAAVCVWKSRVWFVQKDSSVAWYLGTNAVYGTATSFDFGGKMRAGGPLVNLYNWSYDAGGGLDTLLVGLSTAGDLVVYKGTDPTQAATFSIYGSWSVGGVPYGRRVATDFGGELLIMSLNGVVQTSKLVIGAPATVGAGVVYASDKIAPLFNLDTQAYYSNQGWAIVANPGDNTLMCLVPANGSGQAAKPYAMSQSNRSWSLYRDQPLLSAAVWNGVMYFGTPDGRVAKVGGYVDGVLLGNSNSFSAISWSLLTGFRSAGNLRQKQVQTIQPIVEAQEPNPPIFAQAKYNLDITEASPPSGTGIGSSGTWDNATWDNAKWGGGYSEIAPLLGATGIGRTVAIAVRGQSTSRTSLVGIGVMYTEGGLL